jgi:transposase
MIQFIPQLKILLAINPVDFRNGVDGLAALCQKVLAADPFSGALFVFKNRRAARRSKCCVTTRAAFG